MSPTSQYVQCNGFEIHITQWGAADAPVVIAWHGLSRTGRDMDELAQHLCTDFRVICPDTIGRGFSQWSTNHAVDYCLQSYARIAAALFEQLHIEQAHWVGTSMGGAIGMVCASGLYQPQLKHKIRSLTMNDMAPEVAAAALENIRNYAGSPPTFATMAELEGFFRRVYTPFGWMSNAQWRRMTETSARRLPDGRITTHYDPAIVQQLINHPDDYLNWNHYDVLDVPTLCLHGVKSDLVLAPTIEAMKLRGPGARGLLDVIEIEGIGHAPALNVPDQLNAISSFLHAAEKR